ncbi:MAG: spore germination protein [Firmicutes bacterium]|nr:spore germination protein [Bacillota bacterium]
MPSAQSAAPLYSSVDANIAAMDAAFADCGDLVKRVFPAGEKNAVRVCVYYIDMLVARDVVDMHILSRLMISPRESGPPDIRSNLFQALMDNGITTADVSEKDDFDGVSLAVLAGDSAVFVDGFARALIVSSRGFPNRGVQSCDSEVVVQGSKEAFSEVMRINTMLIRRRIRDTSLKVKQLCVGTRSRTDIALMYLDGVVRPQILKETEERLGGIEIDGILDSGQVEQMIADDWLTPFPTAQSTERPDKAADAILDGRIVIIVDNSPFVLIVPATFNTFFQSTEDYNQHWLVMSFTRLMRYAAGFIAVALPGLYVALTVFNPEMIPTLMALKMAASRSAIPIPAALEVLIMDIAFELLREAGIRLPRAVGSTIGVVGGLIIGQAAVEAGIVCPLVVIVTALTGIASFAIPHTSMVAGFRAAKYLVLLLSAFLGLLGFWLAFLLVLVHMASLRSFGIPYLFPFASGEINGFGDLRDTVVRAPLHKLNIRPIFASPKNRRSGRETIKDRFF